MPERTRIEQFSAVRIDAGRRTASWPNLVANIRDWLVGNPEVLFLDLCIEQAPDQSRGAEGLVAYLLYREVVGANAVVPLYQVLGHSGNISGPDWFEETTDALGLDLLAVHVAVAPVLADSDAENGKQFVLIGIRPDTGDGAIGAIGGSYNGVVQVGTPPGDFGSVELLSSDGLEAHGVFPVLNRSDSIAIGPGERVLVAHDPRSAHLVMLPRCC